MTGLLDGELAGVHDPAAARTAPWCAARYRGNRRGVRPVVVGVLGAELGRRHLRRRRGPACSTKVRCARNLRLGPEEPIEMVLAQGYARWGTRLLDRLHGPFALVVWSSDDQRGLLAQDQLGGRSLFTFIDGRRVLFATEVSVLLAMLPRRPDPDEIALVHHLVDHGVPDGRTLFRGLGRLGGGCHLELSDSGHVERRHWAPRYQPPLREPRGGPGRTAAPGTRGRRGRRGGHRSNRSHVAERRTRLVSGGRRGSATRAGPEGDLGGFPAEPELDETSWARRVADYTGMALTTVPIERRDPFRAAEDYLRAWQLPLPVPGLIIEEPLIATARRLRAKVVFDGQGGDELFGATPYLVADRLLQLRPRSAWRLARRHPWLGSNPPLRHVWQVFMGGGLRGAVPPGLHTRVRRWREPGRYAPAWLRPALARQYRDTHDPWRWKRLDGPRWWASLGRHADARARDGRHRRLPAPARGRMGGLEARSPLLDLRLVELALRIPPETSFDPVTSRPLVREALRGALPPEVLARKDERDLRGHAARTLQTTENLEWASASSRRAPRGGGRLRRPSATASRPPRSAARGRGARLAGVGGERLERRYGRAVASGHAS